MYSHWRRYQDNAWTANPAPQAMSNPSRQINSRRLPPLASGGKRGPSPQAPGTSRPSHPSPGHFGSTSRTSASPKAMLATNLHQDMVITGFPLAGTYTNSKFRLSPGSEKDHISSFDLNPDIVTTYLHDNHEFLEKYVLNHVSQDQIEKWLSWKCHQQKNRLKSDTNGGENAHRSAKDSITRWKFSLQGDKRHTVPDMTRDIHQNHNRPQVLSELSACIAAAIDADGFNLYLLDAEGQEIYDYKPSSNGNKPSPECRRKVGPGSSIAAYVAHTKETTRLPEYTTNDKYPEGITIGEEPIFSVLLQPVLHANGDIAGVIELYRTRGNHAFNVNEEEISSSILMLMNDLVTQSQEVTASFVIWGSVAVHYAEMYHGMTKQRKLNEFLLTVTKSIFQDIVSMDTVIMKIMNYAKKLVNADRTSLFLLDNRTKELYARVFDMGDDTQDGNTSAIQKEIRFPMDKGVAGHVASTGDILNIPDAYADDRFNRAVDVQTGYRTKTILCMPIYIRGSIIGVVQMVNKIGGAFTKADEESFETFAIYCGLALHHAKLYDKIRRSEQKFKVALEVLSYHSKVADEEADKLISTPIPDNFQAITSYEFSPWSIDNDNKPLIVLYMFRDLYSNTRIPEDPDSTSLSNNTTSRFDMNTLARFTLTVRKNYRAVPYHNWEHAFSVAHAMFTILKTAEHIFSPLECLALFVACLCHDVDHRGYTNQFMKESSSPLAAIYSTSTMEHHHFNHTITVLQNEGHNIFKQLSSEEYKQVLGDIKHCILATDLALFFSNRAKLKEIMKRGEFSWDNKEHKYMLMATSMTACDLCSMYKPWDLQVKLVHIIMEEFWQQGDKEKARGHRPIPMMDRERADQLPSCQGDAEKQAGITPLAMMDREKKDELPKLEVGFLVGICLPCYELMVQVLPATKPMVEGAKKNLKKWQELADDQVEQGEEGEKAVAKS